MKRIRRITQDRVVSAALAAIIALLLLMQGLIGGMAQGSMAASAIDPGRMICSSAGVLAANAAMGEDGGGADVDCPCRALCRLAAIALPAILPGPGLPFRHPEQRIAGHEPVPAPAFPPAHSRRIAEPRAPPLFT